MEMKKKEKKKNLHATILMTCRQSEHQLFEIPTNVSYVFFRPDTSILRALALKSPAGLVSFG